MIITFISYLYFCQFWTQGSYYWLGIWYWWGRNIIITSIWSSEWYFWVFFVCSRLVDTRSDVSWVWCTVNNGLLDDQNRLLILFVYSFSSFYFRGACARLILMSVNLESYGSFQNWWIRKSPNPFKLNKVHAKMCSGVFSFSCFCMDFYSIGLRDDIDGVGVSASISTDITYMAVIYHKFLIMVYLS